MKPTLLFLMGIDIPSSLLVLLLFALTGLGIFIFLDWLFKKLFPRPKPLTRLVVFLSFIIAPSLLLFLAAFIFIPWQNQFSESAQKQYEEEDSLARISDSLRRRTAISPGISLDTIRYNDSLTNTDISLIVPIAGNETLDQQVRTEFQNKSNRFVRFLLDAIKRDSMLAVYGSTFDIEVVGAFRDNRIISYLVVTSYYHAESRFPMPVYSSINFDLTDNKPIRFADYFALISREDSLQLKREILRALEPKDVTIPELSSIDFTIKKDSIWFNLYDYQTQSFTGDILHAKVPKKNLIKNIHAQYK